MSNLELEVANFSSRARSSDLSSSTTRQNHPTCAEVLSYPYAIEEEKNSIKYVVAVDNYFFGSMGKIHVTRVHKQAYEHAHAHVRVVYCMHTA